MVFFLKKNEAIGYYSKGSQLHFTDKLSARDYVSNNRRSIRVPFFVIVIGKQSYF
jgi:hypothetical protein